ncbi:MAG: copper transporter [Nocardioidaceae bacterium]|nr:copper transporter [Nocardioidaceae bacterium]NUS51391.1 copper transporter [Nocardioidaceae bacterium]
MISFRYHIVSIVSVFLALAIGVALGGGPLKGEVDNTLVDQVKRDRAVKANLQAQITGLNSGNTFTDQFAKDVAPTLLADQLRGRSVTVVVLPNAAQSDVDGVSELVGTAGGTVGSTLRVGEQLVDASGKELVDELGSQLEGQAKDVAVPADASPYERMGALIGRAFGTKTDAGSAPDGTTSAIQGGLSAAKLLSVDGKVDSRGSLFLFVGGPGDTAGQDQGSGTIVTTLADAIDQATDGVVVAGPVSSARGEGIVKAVRDDVSAAGDVSTVDSLGRTAGQVVAVMALAGQAAGQSGQYGAVDAADGAMPGANGAGE